MSDIDLYPFQEQILNSSHLYITKRDLLGRYTYVSPSFVQKGELEEGALIGKIFDLTVYKEDVGKIQNAIHQLINHPEEVVSVEIRKVKVSGNMWWIRWDFSAIRDSQGNAIEILGIGHDITEDYNHHLLLVESANKLNTILDSITDGFYAVNNDWLITKVNKVAEQTLGVKAEDLVGKNLWEVFPNDANYVYPTAFQRAMEKKTTLRFEEYFDKRWFANTVYPSLEGINVFFRDITEQKAKEEAIKSQEKKLKESIQKLKSISDSTSDIYILVGRDYHIFSFNKTAQKEFYNYYKKEIKEGQNFLQYAIKGTKKSFKSNFAKALAGESVIVEMSFPILGGTKQWRQLRYFPVYNDENQIFAVSINAVDIDIIKKQRKQLKIQAAELRSVLDSTSDFIVLISPSYRVMLVNKVAQEQTKLRQHKAMEEGDDIRKYSSKQNEEQFEENFRKALGGQTVSLVREMIFDDAESKRWYRHTYTPAYDDELQIIGVSYTATDIDEEKKKNDIIAESEARFKKMAGTAPVMIWMTQVGEDFIYFNGKWIDFTGRTLEENYGYGWLESVHSEDKAMVVYACTISAKKEKEFEMRYRMKRYDGKYRWLLERRVPRTDSTGAFWGHIGSCVDITEIAEAQEAVEEKTINLEKALNESNKLSMIVKNTNDMVILADAEGRITWINEAFTKVTAYTLDEVAGMKPELLLQGEDTDPIAIEQLSQAIDNKQTINIEILNYTKLGKTYWAELHIQPMYDAQNNPIGFMSVLSVITERKEAAQKILNRNKLLERIAFIQSHELRRPVADILGLIMLIKEQDTSSQDLKIWIEHLEKAAEDLDNVIHNIVDKTYFDDID